MPQPPLSAPADDVLAAGFAAIRRDLQLPDAFPPDALAEAASGPAALPRADRRGDPFVTIDPPGSLDLDQAVALSRTPTGYRVSYAIADVAAFVRPGGALDAETHRRGVTIYLPDGKVPLHPLTLSEGVASLLPGDDRLAAVWDIELDADGQPVATHVERAVVRSTAKLNYPQVQAALDNGTAGESLALLREIGSLRDAREVERGGVSLPVPDQEVVAEDDGSYRLEYKAPLPVEGWNAQLSLLTGICAARMMLDGGIGILRTLPPPPADVLTTLRHRALALGIDWPDGKAYADVVRSLDPAESHHAAFVVQAARLFRGAGYASFDGTPPAGTAAEHAAVKSPYAHVTAPLRRLVDRYGLEVCLALSGGGAVPDWARQALPALPATMATARQREGSAGAMARDLVEAAILAGRVGDAFDGVAVDVEHGHTKVMIREPAVVTTVAGEIQLGSQVRLRLAGVDITARRVWFDR